MHVISEYDYYFNCPRLEILGRVISDALFQLCNRSLRIEAVPAIDLTEYVISKVAGCMLLRIFFYSVFPPPHFYAGTCKSRQIVERRRRCAACLHPIRPQISHGKSPICTSCPPSNSRPICQLPRIPLFSHTIPNSNLWAIAKNT